MFVQLFRLSSKAIPPCTVEFFFLRGILPLSKLVNPTTNTATIQNIRTLNGATEAPEPVGPPGGLLTPVFFSTFSLPKSHKAYTGYSVFTINITTVISGCTKSPSGGDAGDKSSRERVVVFPVEK